MPMRDLAGQRFGCLQAERIDGRDAQGRFVWLCRCECGATKRVRSRNLVQRQVTSCGCRQFSNPAKTCLGKTGAAHPKWKGGRYIDRNGYVRVYVGAGKYEAEHRLVAGVSDPNVLVHHIDEQKNNNEPSNLQPMSRAAHAREHGLGRRIHP